ncbi:MAG: molecular chaperone HscC [Algicola sp.]|nr:molecular chaperone HscC [Algicola sp.]
MATIGIDLGTTNSLCACWQDGQSTLIVNGNGQFQTPSVVGFDDEGQILVGEAAKQRLQTHPYQTTANFKRYMGSNREVKLGNKSFRAEELSALVLKSLKADAEAYLQETVTCAVISVPAYFNDAQRKATKTAGTIAGLEVKRLINEPTAAAIAYGLHQKEDDTTFLIFDIGGGTFDVSILELFDGVMQVNATAGDNHLGGEDFVEVLTNDFATQNGLKAEKLDGELLALTLQSAERCKLALTNEQTAKMVVRFNDTIYQHQYSREHFYQLTAPLVERLKQPLQRAINDAQIDTSDIDAVVMVGGASRMPQIRSMAAKLMGQIPSASVNPDDVIALGTAVQVGLLMNDVALEEVVLTDVSPYTLGVDMHNVHAREKGHLLYHPIIERNSPIPISKVDRMYTVEDAQTKINVGIYQGESRLVKDNVKLGELTLAVPSAPAGRQAVDIRFTYDVNGLLEVETQILSTGKHQSMVIEGSPGSMSSEEIETRLKALEKLKIHPRDKLQNTTLLARGERLYEASLGEKRQYISDVITQFEGILQRQNPKEIEPAVKSLTELFDTIEHSLWPV